MSSEVLTERDIEIFELMSQFAGKMFIEVLSETIWKDYTLASQQARNRLTKLTKKGYLLKKKTGLMCPRSGWVLTEKGKDLVFDEFGIKLSSAISISASTTNHLIIEMISYYWLKKLDKNPIRTTVSRWSKEHRHTPDIAYFKEDKLIYVEIERNFKANGVYNSIFVNIIKDDVYRVLYIVENEKRVQQFANNLPNSDKIMIISIDDFVENAKNGKIGAVTQKKLRIEKK